MENCKRNLPIYIEQLSQPSVIAELMPIIEVESDRLKKVVSPIIDQIAMLHLRKKNAPHNPNNTVDTKSRDDEFVRLASHYHTMLGEVLGIGISDAVSDTVVVPKTILDYLVREVNYAWWSEGCLFNLTEAEAGEVEKFMAAYNRDEHLNLIINYEEE